MGNRFASGKNAISECDRCGFQYKLTVLRKEIIKTKNYSILVCPTCWDPDQPQLQLGMYPVMTHKVCVIQDLTQRTMRLV